MRPGLSVRDINIYRLSQTVHCVQVELFKLTTRWLKIFQLEVFFKAGESEDGVRLKTQVFDFCGTEGGEKMMMAALSMKRKHLRAAERPLHLPSSSSVKPDSESPITATRG